jgi:hypothetical protein
MPQAMPAASNIRSNLIMLFPAPMVPSLDPRPLTFGKIRPAKAAQS